MKRLAFFLSLALAALAANVPRISRASLGTLERSVDRSIVALDVNDQFDLLGTTRAVYLDGFGVVFSAEVNLVVSPVSPFHPPLDKKGIARLHDRKVARLAQLKTAMRDQMVNAAVALDNIPSSEEIVFGISLWYRSFENREGLPAQVVMRAPRQALLDYKAGKTKDAAIRVEEL